MSVTCIQYTLVYCIYCIVYTVTVYCILYAVGTKLFGHPYSENSAVQSYREETSHQVTIFKEYSFQMRITPGTSFLGVWSKQTNLAGVREDKGDLGGREVLFKSSPQHTLFYVKMNLFFSSIFSTLERGIIPNCKRTFFFCQKKTHVLKNNLLCGPQKLYKIHCYMIKTKLQRVLYSREKS